MQRTHVITEEDFKVFEQRAQGKVGGAANCNRQDGTRVGATGVTAVLRGNLSSSPPQPRLYDSKWEETYAAELVLRKHAGLIRNYYYHPFSMWLPGKVRYTPDFMIEYPDGMEKRLEIIEIKGWSRNLRDGMTRLKIAAAIFPCFTWKLVRKQKGGGWSEEDVC